MGVKKIIQIDDKHQSDWDAFVETHPFGWLTHLSSWTQVLHASFKHIKGRIVAVVDGAQNTIVAGYPMYTVRSWLTGTRIVCSPFATLFDPLVSNEDDLQLLMQASREFMKKDKAKHIEMRTVHASQLMHKAGYFVDRYYKHHYINLNIEPEALKKKFDRTCVRQRINRALKSDIELIVGSDENDLNEFYRLYLKTRKRKCLPPQPYDFLKNIWTVFYPQKKLELLLAKTQGRIIAGMILFKYKNRVSSEFAVSDDNFVTLSPNHFLFWHAIVRACKEGYRIFDFGHTSPANSSLMDFKKRWATEIVDLPYCYYPASAGDGQERDVSAMYKFVQMICKSSPDCVVKQIGNFCYRHLG